MKRSLEFSLCSIGKGGENEHAVDGCSIFFIIIILLVLQWNLETMFHGKINVVFET